jgi:hypothetical protein
MAMGIRRPGFQLLSLISSVPSPDHITQTPVPPPLHAPCFMPNQLGIYFYIYIPLGLVTLLFLLASNITRANKGIGYQIWSRKHSRQDSPEALHELSRGKSSHAVDADSFLPPPANKSRDHRTPAHGRSYSSPWTWRFTFGGQRRRIALPNPFGTWRSRGDHRTPQRDVGVLVGLLQDLGAIAWPPIFVFLGISLWVMQW